MSKKGEGVGRPSPYCLFSHSLAVFLSFASVWKGKETAATQANRGLDVFSVFTSHVIKIKNRNRSMNKVKNLGYDR